MTGDSVHPGVMFEHDPQLAAFASDLRAAADAAPPPVVGASLAAVLEGREVPASPPWLPRNAPRRRATGLRWVIGGAAFGLGIGSLGVAGALPDPVQRQVARFGDVVGVDLPEPAEDTPATSVVPTVVPSSTVPPARSHTTTTTPAGTDDDLGGDRGEDHGTSTSVEDRGQGDEHRDDNGSSGSDNPGRDVSDDHRGSGSDNGDNGGDDGSPDAGEDQGSLDKRGPSDSGSSPTSLDSRGSSGSDSGDGDGD